MKNVIHLLTDEKLILEVRDSFISPKQAEVMVAKATKIWKEGGILALQAANFEIRDERPTLGPLEELEARVSKIEEWISHRL